VSGDFGIVVLVGATCIVAATAILCGWWVK